MSLLAAIGRFVMGSICFGVAVADGIDHKNIESVLTLAGIALLLWHSITFETGDKP